MTSCGDYKRGVDSVGIHAGLVVVVHGYKSPVCDDTCDADLAVRACGASDEVFDGGGVEELDVGERKDFGEEGGCEEGSVLDDHVVSFIFVGDAKVDEEFLGGFAHYHCREELAAEPGSTT